MSYFDAHCHLMNDEVFLHAQTKGVRAFIVNTTKPAEWDLAADLHKRVTGIYYCVGAHPWFVDELPKNWEKAMENFLKRNPNAMIGEIGLDKKRPSFERQIQVFTTCLELATQYERKVHIHCVDAWEEMFECLTQYRGLSMLFHRFSGDETIIQKLRMLNCYFSVLNGRFVDMIPDNRLLVETDAPDGLKTPVAIPALVQALNLNKEMLKMNFEGFLDGMGTI